MQIQRLTSLPFLQEFVVSKFVLRSKHFPCWSFIHSHTTVAFFSLAFLLILLAENRCCTITSKTWHDNKLLFLPHVFPDSFWWLLRGAQYAIRWESNFLPTLRVIKSQNQVHAVSDNLVSPPPHSPLRLAPLVSFGLPSPWFAPPRKKKQGSHEFSWNQKIVSDGFP